MTRQRAETLVILDAQIAATIKALKDSGQLQKTYIAFTSDNGYYLGEHLKRQGKINLHEPSIRVPLLLAGPNVPRGTRYDPVTGLDLAVTVAAWSGADLASPDGRSLAPLIIDGDIGWNHPVVLEGLMPEAGYLKARSREGWDSGLDTIGIRTGRWKLIRYSTGETELYDLRADPLELNSIPLTQAPDGLAARLLQVWEDYVTCAGADCLRPLSEDLRLTPKENRDVTTTQASIEADYYG